MNQDFFESPFMRALDIIASLLVLNFLTVICSLPVFTFGAAYTALHRQLYKLRSNEDGYLVRDYFHEFKRNFKQATKVWLVAVYALCFTLCLCTVYVFPILARYETTCRNALKNALAMAFFAFFKSILMVAVTIAPWVAAVFIPNFILIDLLFGFALPAYICVFLYAKTFQSFETKQEETEQTGDEALGMVNSEK
jgi:uncharacterized membrane protein YesL